MIDERANAAQRQGMLSILTGKETDPMATFWAVYTAMCEKVHNPVYTRINIDIDMPGRKAKCSAEGAADGRGEPILNPVTGPSIAWGSCCRTASNTGRTRLAAAGRPRPAGCN